ncbi:uncharacterized protein LOC124142803 [Haliotis rufescens]|uniref:uncharacterized protein LOC124142803 n=1 Tax=Haliotis rufescens TaxID=6454 RepID=UPI00201E9061|nr:uncharacterized protein LOC124142803 [Haliotis rufescens]
MCSVICHQAIDQESLTVHVNTISIDEYTHISRTNVPSTAHCDHTLLEGSSPVNREKPPQYIMYMQVFVLLLLVTLTQGFSDGGQIETETNKWGTDIFYCTYHGIKFMPGSMWKTTECEQCSCFDDGLFCEGFGYAAGAFDAPEGCEVVNDGCDPRMVDAEDALKPCVAK